MALTPRPERASGSARFAARAILVVGVLFLVVGLSLLLLFGFNSPGLPAAIWGLLLVVVYGFFEPDTVRAFLGQGQLQAGTKAFAQVLLVIAAVVMLNVFVHDRLADKQLDLTKNHVNSLAPQTVTIVQQLDRPVTATIWSQSSTSENQAAFDLLQRYRGLNNRLTIHSYVLQDHPGLAQQQQIQQTGSVVFETPGRPSQITTDLSEQGFDTVLLRMATGKSPKAYFLTGHGEPSTQNPSQAGTSMTVLAAALQKQGFTVAELDLSSGGPAAGATPAPSPAATASPAAASPSPSSAPGIAPSASPSPASVAATRVPADADEVIILDPRTNLGAAEVTAINTYVDGGGHLLVSEAPGVTTNVNEVLTRFGVTVGGGLVLDPKLQANNRQVGFLQLTTYGNSVVARGLEQLPSQFFDSAVQGQAKTGYTLTPVVTTTDQSCLKTDLSGSADCGAGDKKGPFNLVVTLEQASPKPGTRAVRAVVMGGSLFASDIFAANQVAAPPANQPLMLNAANWLAGQDKVINVPAQTTSTQNIFLTDAQRQLVLLGYPVLLPLLFLGLGVNAYLRRR